MNLNDINISDFSTDIFKLAFLSKNYKLLPNVEGFIKNKNEMTLFSAENLYNYHKKYKKVKLFQLTPSQYDYYAKEFKSKNLKSVKTKSSATILELDHDFFKLEGKTFEKIRRYKNLYSKRTVLEVKTEPNSIQEVHDFINKWKKIREGAHFQFTTGYDYRFFEDTYPKYRENFVALYFYLEGEMVGFTVLERVNDSLYNLLFRKTDTNLINSCLYVDYYSFDYIYQKNKQKFFVNLGGDVMDKKLRFYKTNTFNVPYKELPMIDLKLVNDDIPDEVEINKPNINSLF